MRAINLIGKYADRKEFFTSKVKEYKGYTPEHPNFKTGDVIEFLGGYNNDILYSSEITGFDTDGDIYVLWDCYWFPIRNEEIRQIKLIN